MAIRTAVVNEALTWLHQPQSAGVDDDTDSLVVRLRSAFTQRAEIFLESYPWNFAKTVELLAQTASASGFEGWDYGFVKPAGCYRIIKVDSQADMRKRPNIPFEERAGLICTNSETTYLAYVDGSYATSDTGSWPKIVQSALALDLADMHAASIDLAQTKMDKLTQRALKVMKDAKRWDAQQNQTYEPPMTSWQRARLSGGSYRRDG